MPTLARSKYSSTAPEQFGMNLTWPEIPEDRFSFDVAQMSNSRILLCVMTLTQNFKADYCDHDMFNPWSGFE